MAANAQEEQAWIDGTHPALAGNEPKATLRERAGSDASSTSSRSSSPRFRAIDDDPPPSTSQPPTRNGGASNTGPKGVLADYEARGGGSGNTGPKGVLSDYRGANSNANARVVAEMISKTKTVLSLDDEAEDEEDWEAAGLDEDARAKEQYRRQRLMEMKGSGERRAPSGRGRRLFGHLREIGTDQFLSAVDDEEADVAVILHLYEPEIDACVELNRHLSAVARAYPRTKFIRALATELDFSADNEEDTLPTVLVYRGGDLETTLVRPDLEWGRGTRADVEALLRRHMAISGSPVLPLNTSGAGFRRDSEVDDDDDE